MPEFQIFSDGGGEKDSNAGAACIVRTPEGNEFRVVAFLGSATNNEGEITAGLLGLSFLQTYREQQGLGRISVRWVSDSEYVLKSATEYILKWQKNGWKTADKSDVKNQGLWRAFLKLSENFDIIPEHVRGHTGHAENEACDTAVTWIRNNGAAMLYQNRGQSSLNIVGTGDEPWLIIDGRKFIDRLREEAPSLRSILAVKELLSEQIVSAVSSPSNSPGVAKVLKELEEVEALAKSYGEGQHECLSLAKDIANIVARYKK